MNIFTDTRHTILSLLLLPLEYDCRPLDNPEDCQQAIQAWIVLRRSFLGCLISTSGNLLGTNRRNESFSTKNFNSRNGNIELDLQCTIVAIQQVSRSVCWQEACIQLSANSSSGSLVLSVEIKQEDVQSDFYSLRSVRYII